jgi:hypothetical protein
MRSVVWFGIAVLVIALSVTASARSNGADASGWAANVKSSDGCTCHGPTNAGTKINDLEGWPASYLPGQTYSLVLSSTTDVTSPAAPQSQGGFLAWVNRGTLAPSVGSESWIKAGEASGASFVAHVLQGERENTAQTWSFVWTAPSAGSGPVELRAFVNRVNGNGGADSGDHWNKRSFTATEGSAVSSPPPSTEEPTSSIRSSPKMPPSSTAPPTEPAPGLVMGVLAAAAALVVLRRRIK